MAEGTAFRTVVVTNPQGLHARPADMFVKLASKYQSNIEVIKDGERVDGKSILAILTLAAVQGTQLRIEATGPDAEAALRRVGGVGRTQLRRNWKRGINSSRAARRSFTLSTVERAATWRRDRVIRRRRGVARPPSGPRAGAVDYRSRGPTGRSVASRLARAA